jgi:AICAR transformylase/IMP cyclohydrolase PurH
MNTGEKQAVISVYDKSNLSHLMRSMVGLGWDIFATEGSAKVYKDDTGLEVSRFSDLVAASGEPVSPDREQIARSVSRIIVQKRTVQLVCVNLKPPQPIENSVLPRYTFDMGGLAMITAGNIAKALMVTAPEQYDPVIEQLRREDGIEPDFQHEMAYASRAHAQAYTDEYRHLTDD